MYSTSLYALLAGTLIGHLAACGRYVVPPTLDQGFSDAALVARASHHPTGPRDLGIVMAAGGWRFVWAAPADSERGVFVFHGSPKHERFVNVWGGTPDHQSVYQWASRDVGAPAALARCVAHKLTTDGL